MAALEPVLSMRSLTRADARSWRTLLRTAVGVAWIILVAFLATYNLETFPTTWFDEGSHLHVPKTLVQQGVYADLSSEGFRYFGPTSGLGPTVMLPIALVFKIAGVGLLQARLVMAVYLLVAVALAAEVARRQYGRGAAWLATLLLVAAPAVNLLFLGRQVLGEVPGLAFLLLGMLLWWASLDPRRGTGGTLVGAGLAFGLAALTKNQLALILVPTFALVLLADRAYYRQGRLAHYAVPVLLLAGAIGLGILLQLAPVLGTADLARTLALWRDASAGAIFTFSPARALSSLKLLAGPDAYAHWAVPALVYGLALARPRTLGGLRQAFLLTFVLVGLAWYVGGSIGWARYAFAPLAVAALCAAKLFRDLVVAVARDGVRDPLLGRGRAMAAAVVLAVGLMVGHSLLQQARTIVFAADRSPQLVAGYLDASVPRGEVIETWEPELGFLTDHRYHYPPLGWLDRAVRAKWLQTDAPLAGYDPIAEASPSYLVVGRFAKYTGIYSATLAHLGSPPIASFGDYDIYALAER